MRPIIPRAAALAGCALLTALLTAGCGFVTALAHPAAPPSAPTNTPATATSTAAQPRLLAAAQLTSPGGQPASLTVTEAAPRTGSPPIDLGDCRLPGDGSIRYVALAVTFTDRGPAPSKLAPGGSNLSTAVTVTGPGDAGVLIGSYYGGPYCPGRPVLPAADHFRTVDLFGEHETVTVYVVGRVTAARPDPLQGVTVRLGDLRKANDDVEYQGPWTWRVQHLDAGATCPDDAAALCFPAA